MSLIKVAPFVLGVDPWGPGCSRTYNVLAQQAFLVIVISLYSGADIITYPSKEMLVK